MRYLTILRVVVCMVLLPIALQGQDEEHLSMDDLLHKWVKLIHAGKTKELLEGAQRVPVLDYQLITSGDDWTG